MRKCKCLSIVAICLLCVSLFCFSVESMETPFESKPVDQGTAREVFERLELSILQEEYHGDGQIDGFDINSNGQIAIIYSSDYINIYNPDGSFCRSYTFLESGASSILYDREDGNLILHLVRGNYLIKFTENGELLEMDSFSGSEPANNDYSFYLAEFRTLGSPLIFEKTQNGNRYIYEKASWFESLFLGKTHTLTMIKPGGAPICVYDDQGAIFRKRGKLFIFYFSVVLLFVLSLFARYQWHRKSGLLYRGMNKCKQLVRHLFPNM